MKCYLSYTDDNKEFVTTEIIPILKELLVEFSIKLTYFDNKDDMKYSYENNLKYSYNEIFQSDFVIYYYDRSNQKQNLEIGYSLGRFKPILILKERETSINDWSFSVIEHCDLNFPFASTSLRYLKISISRIIERVRLNNDLDISNEIFTYHQTNNIETKLIALHTGIENEDIYEELKFTYQFIEFVNNIIEKPDIKLLKASKGSFSTLFSIDVKSWVELLEKIIFFIPELKKKKLERLKIDAEIEKIYSETRSLNVDTNIKQAEAFFSLLNKCQEIGIQIQMDENLLISLNQDGILSFKKPPQHE